MQDNDRSFSGRLNLSRCYWEENGIEEQPRGSEGEDGGPEVGVLSQGGAAPEDGKRDKPCTPLHLRPSTVDHWRLRRAEDSIPVTGNNSMSKHARECVFFYFY